MIYSTPGQCHTFNWSDDWLFTVSGEDGALIGPNFNVVASVVLDEKLARLREGCRVMRQFADFER